MKLIEKVVMFLFKKKVEGATEGLTAISKTKIFMTLEGLLMAIEFVSPYFGHIITFPDHIHKLLYTLAGISYAERAVKSS